MLPLFLIAALGWKKLDALGKQLLEMPDSRLESIEMPERLRDALVFKADVHLVAPDTFEKPGAAKVAFVLREYPELP